MKIFLNYLNLSRILILFLSLVFLNCQQKVRSHNWFAMDTNMSVSIYGSTPISDDSVFSRLEKETEKYNEIFSDYSPVSGLSKIKGNKGDTLTIEPEIYSVLKIALKANQQSCGSFDITLHTLKSLWGMGSGQQGKVPDSSTIDSIMQGNPTYHASYDSCNFPMPITMISENRVVLERNNVLLDLGAIAKGYIIDRLDALLNTLGCPTHIIQSGGEIRLGGKKAAGPWSVGIRHPRASDSLAGLISWAGPKAVSTSGDYERFFMENGKRYHHIFDPRQGRPSDKLCAVTVITDSSVIADALSTSLFVLGPKRGLTLAKLHNALVVWFEERNGNVCAIPMPEILPYLDLNGTQLCQNP